MNWIVLADETSALGWRLAGAEVRIVGDEPVDPLFEAARRSADLLFLTTELAARLAPARLEDALLGEHPLVLVIGALGPQAQELPDLEQAVRRAFGVGV